MLKWTLSADVLWELGCSHQPHGWCSRSGGKHAGNVCSLKTTQAAKPLHQHHCKAHKNSFSNSRGGRSSSRKPWLGTGEMWHCSPSTLHHHLCEFHTHTASPKQTQHAAGTELTAKALHPLPPPHPIPLHLAPLLCHTLKKPRLSQSLPIPQTVLNSCSQIVFGLPHLPFVVYTHQQEMGPLSHTLGLGGKMPPLQRLIPRSCSNPRQSFWPSSAPSQEQPGSHTLSLPAALLWKLTVKSNICILISNNHMFHLHCNFHLCSELFEAWTN